MEETAFIANSANTGWVPVKLLDISTNGISFSCSEILLSGYSHSMRFSLSVERRLQQVSVVLLPRTTEGVASGYRYSGWFARIDPPVFKSISEFIRNSKI